jgi:hypothetical protein
MKITFKDEKKIYEDLPVIGRIYFSDDPYVLILPEKFVNKFSSTEEELDKAFRSFGENVSLKTWKNKSKNRFSISQTEYKLFSSDRTYYNLKAEALKRNNFHGALNTDELELYIKINDSYYNSKDVDFIYKEKEDAIFSCREDGRKFCSSDAVILSVQNKLSFDSLMNEFSKVIIRLNENAVLQPIPENDFHYNYF